MSITKKHFGLVAEAVRVERPDMFRQTPEPAHWRDNELLDRVADNLAAQFKMLNPRFDKAKFIKATQRPTEEG